MANTIAPKNFEQESDATKFPTALVIIWNNGGELKKANISQVVNANILKDATPIQNSTRLITSGGVWNFTYSKAQIDLIAAMLNSAKANRSEVYTKTQVDTLLGDKANVADVYVKTEVYSKTEIDNLANSFIILLGGKENIATEDDFADNTSIALADNTIYTASEAISALEILGSNGTSVVSFDTAASGTITITLPLSIKFTEAPTFGNSEHWEIAVRNGYAVFTKYDLV